MRCASLAPRAASSPRRILPVVLRGISAAATHSTYRGLDGLAPDRIRDPEQARLLDRGVTGEPELDLGGVHVLAAALDEVLRAIDERQRAVVVRDDHVAGVEPAAAEG